MYIIDRFKLPFFVVFWLMFSSFFVYASQIDNMYKDLTLLDKTAQIGRKSYTTIGDKFYKIYADNPRRKAQIAFYKKWIHFYVEQMDASLGEKGTKLRRTKFIA